MNYLIIDFFIDLDIFYKECLKFYKEIKCNNSDTIKDNSISNII